MPIPGAYKAAADTFVENGYSDLGGQIKNGELKLAIAASITGSVKTRPDLSGLFSTMIGKCAELSEADREHYRRGLKSGGIVPALAAGARVYQSREAQASALAAADSKTWAPGELFMRS
jgi:hypothetical protein